MFIYRGREGYNLMFVYRAGDVPCSYSEVWRDKFIKSHVHIPAGDVPCIYRGQEGYNIMFVYRRGMYHVHIP